MKLLLLTLSFLVVAACASPYKQQAESLKTMYESGQITAAQYQSSIIQLESLDLQRRQTRALALMEAGKHLSNIGKQYDTYYPYYPQTQGVIYGPQGQYYWYESY